MFYVRFPALLAQKTCGSEGCLRRGSLLYLVMLAGIFISVGILAPAYARQQPGATGDSSLSVFQADAALQSLLSDSSGGTGDARLRHATDLYRQILHAAAPALASETGRVVRRHVAQAAWLVPDGVLRDVVANPQDAPPETWHFKEGAGERLLAWWRSQDPVLRTAGNERLREHLRRVAYAEQAYPDPERLTRLDDRGEVYVRYGKPSEQAEVSYNEASFHKEVYRFGVPVAMSDFPPNELWLYPELGQSAYFLFTEKDGSYHLAASTNDLLPAQLRNGFGRSERSLNKAVSSLAALRHIYKQLAMHHIDFSGRYNGVDRYVQQQKQQSDKALAGLVSGRQQVVGEGIGSQQVIVTEDPVAGLVLPSAMLKQTLDRSYADDRRAARWRAENMPRQKTSVLSSAAPLPVAVRTARFLEEDGTTRTEVYWSVPPGALRLPEDQHKRYGSEYVRRSRPLLALTALQQDEKYKREETYRKQYLLQGTTQQAAERTIPPQQLAFRSTSEVYHISLQWMQQMVQVRPESERFAPGPLVRAGQRRLDSLRRLAPDRGRLEMSDLRPMVLPEEADLQSGNLAEAAVLYPFAEVAPHTPLLFYFEVYHLRYDADDRTRYTVEYEVRRRTEQGTLARLLRPSQDKSTATQVTYAGRSSRAEEYILLELDKWGQGKKGDITIVVRVTDETTGQQVERPIAFEVAVR